MPIEEITKIGVAIATILGTAIAAIIRSNKKSDEPDAEVDTEQLSKELQEVQKLLNSLHAEVHGKHLTQLTHIEEDVSRLFDKTDKLTDILIDYFSKQSNK